MKLLIFCIVVELLGIITCGVGIGVEMATGAEFWHILTTAGAVTIAAGGLVFAKFWRTLRHNPYDVLHDREAKMSRRGR